MKVRGKKGVEEIDAKEKALLSVRAAESKKANDVVLLDLRERSNFTDYFVICSGNTQRQMKAVVEAVIEKLQKKGVSPWHSEGIEGNAWMLLDYGDVVVHVFESAVREFYDLEHLWGDAPRVNVPRSRSKQAGIK